MKMHKHLWGFLFFLFTFSAHGAEPIGLPALFVVVFSVVPVYKEIEGNARPVGTLPVDEIIVGSELRLRQEVQWLRISHPLEGWVVLRDQSKNGGKQKSLNLLNVFEVCFQNKNRDDDKGSKSFPITEYILASCSSAIDWLHQWPVGTGRIGAMVGGKFSNEVIPLSIADLFMISRSPFLNSNKEFYNSNDTFDSFRSSRAALSNKRYHDADRLLRSIKQHQEGHFEFVAELCLTFLKHSNKIQDQSSTSASSMNSMVPPINVKRNARRKLGEGLVSSLQKQQVPRPVRFQKKQHVKQKGPASPSSRIIVQMPDLIQGNQRISATSIGIGRVLPPPNLSVLSGGRNLIISQLHTMLSFAQVPDHIANALDPEDNEEKKIRQYASILDTRSGVASSFFIVNTRENDANKNSKNVNNYHIHSRQWFASAVDNVIVGRLSCVSASASSSSTSSATASSNGCLNIGMSLSRGAKVEANPPMYEIRILKDKGSGRSKTDASGKADNEGDSDDQSLVRRMSVTIGPTATALLPNVHLLMVLVCHTNNPAYKGRSRNGMNQEDSSSSSSSSSSRVFGSPFEEPGYQKQSRSMVTEVRSNKTSAFVCENAYAADIYITIEKEDNLAAAAAAITLDKSNSLDDLKAKKKSALHNSGFDQKVVKRLSQKCWERMNKALSLGGTELLRRHRETFASRMDRVGLQFGPAYMPNDNNQKGSEDLHLARLTASFFQYARYLMLSSASGSTSNLQGVWAEGRQSMWSGDYHFNINIQMQYWAADVAAIPEVMGPYMDFIDKMRDRGADAARHMYQCKGWVAHGFTDGFMNMGILGDLQWSYCITCGVWTSLSLWDHLTYIQSDISNIGKGKNIETIKINDHFQTVLLKLIIAMEGVADFFLDYFHIEITADGKSIYHTGPTTSPETSYSVRTDTKTNTYQLAFSPAIDCSVLRQAANAFQMSLSIVRYIIEQRDDNKGESNTHPLLNVIPSLSALKGYEHKSSMFLKAVMSMPAGALPAIGVNFNRILEYPRPAHDVITATSPLLVQNADGNTVSVDKMEYISEDIDPGHRHYSLLHWLYPGVFLPTRGSSSAAFYSAAKNTLKYKSEGGGGHTSWSAAWEATLWARVGEGEEAYKSILKVISRYSSQRMLSMHPPLQPTTNNNGNRCKTCFSEKLTGKDKLLPNINRGFLAKDRSAFQLDGNMGILAATCEMLLQTQAPGHVVILPALSLMLAKLGGKVRGLRGRGNIEVSFSWSGEGNAESNLDARVSAVALTMHAAHPWFASSPSFVPISKISSSSSSSSSSASSSSSTSLPPSDMEVGGMSEDSPGYFSWRGGALASSTSDLFLTYPLSAAGGRSTNLLRLVSSSTTGVINATKMSRGSFEEMVDKTPTEHGTACAYLLVRKSAPSNTDLSQVGTLLPFYPSKSTQTNKTPGGVNRGSSVGSRMTVGVRIFKYPCRVLFCAGSDGCNDSEL